MGSFAGHVLPGSFFIVFAVWWTVQMFRRYFSARTTTGTRFKSTVTYPVDFCCCGPTWLRRWEWEGFFKVLFTLIGFLGEVITGLKHENGRFVHPNNGQHATMFFFFGMSGVVDILVHHRAHQLPESIEYLSGCLAFVVEAVLFKFHLHGRTEFDILTHTLLLYVVYANIVITVMEIRYRHSISVAMARVYTVFLQGTWFWQVGFLLYNPLPGAVPWDEEDHEQMMVLVMIFAWHMAAVFVIMVCIGAVVAACQVRCSRALAAADGDESDGVRLLRRTGEMQSTSAADYDAELDSDCDAIDLTGPAISTRTVRPVDDIIQL